MRNDVYPQVNVKRPPTQESGWIKGTQTTNVFQENTLWNSANSILKGDSSLKGKDRLDLRMISILQIHPGTFALNYPACC
jgi:hypothetical protein